jgi:hypothetical protein
MVEAEAGRLAALAAQTAHENAAKIIAVHIRNQGYFCWEASRAEKDRERSLPDKAVWVLNCQNATYRVRLIPKTAAYVERLDDNDASTLPVTASTAQ